MIWYRNSSARWVLRPTGAALLLIGWRTTLHLVAVGQRHARNEPPIVYLLALLVFACGSAGAALLVHGHHLFDRVQISERWIARAPRAIPQSSWDSELDPVRSDPARGEGGVGRER